MKQFLLPRISILHARSALHTALSFFFLGPGAWGAYSKQEYHPSISRAILLFVVRAYLTNPITKCHPCLEMQGMGLEAPPLQEHHLQCRNIPCLLRLLTTPANKTRPIFAFCCWFATVIPSYSCLKKRLQ